MDKRPRRSNTQKKLDHNEGLLWQEERDLTRALYASLQKPRSEQDVLSDGEQPDSENPQEPSDRLVGCSETNALPSTHFPVQPTDTVIPSVSSALEPPSISVTEPLSVIEVPRQENHIELGESVVEESPKEEDSLKSEEEDREKSKEEDSEKSKEKDCEISQEKDCEKPTEDCEKPTEDCDKPKEDNSDDGYVEEVVLIVPDTKAKEPQHIEEHSESKKVKNKPETVKVKNSHKKKDSSKGKDLPKTRRSPKGDKPSKKKDTLKIKSSDKGKPSRKGKESPGKIEAKKQKKVSTKPRPLSPVVTRARSPKSIHRNPAPPKPLVAQSDSIARRLRASGSTMGNAFRSFRAQEPVPTSAAIATKKDMPVTANDSRKGNEFLPPPPPPKQTAKSNATPKQRKPAKTTKKVFAVIKDKSSSKFKKVPSPGGQAPKPKPVIKRPMRSLRRDLRSRSKFKMPQADAASAPTTRRSTRSQATSSSSGVSSSNDSQESQDETKSTSSVESWKSKPRRVKEIGIGSKRNSGGLVSSTSGEDDDARGSKPKKAKVQAQRKFAYPHAYSPGCTPSKLKNGDQLSAAKACNIFNHCPATEDFLTFLCLRGTPALPPSLDLFKVPSKPSMPVLWPAPKQLAGRKRNSNGTIRSEDISIPGIEPLPPDEVATPTATPPKSNKSTPSRSAKASPSLAQEREKIRERRLRLDARQFKSSGKLKKNLRNSFKSSPNNIASSAQQMPPNLTPVPPAIPTVPCNRHPPPLTPIVPWQNKRFQANNQHRGALRQPARKPGAKVFLARPSGRSSRTNSVPSKNNNNNAAHQQPPRREKPHQDQTNVIATSKAKDKDNGQKKEIQRNGQKVRERKRRKSDRLKGEKCAGTVLNGSNHVLEKLEDPPNGHTLLSQLKLLKGSKRERKEKRCSCHSQNCTLKTRSRHKNGDRDLRVVKELVIEEVLKAKKQKKEFKQRSSRKVRKCSMSLRDRVHAVEMELDDSILDKAETILTNNGINKKLTIPLTNCTLNNNILRKDNMVPNKAHLNHEMEKKLNELKIKEDEEGDLPREVPPAKSRKVRNPLLVKNHKELPSPRVATSELTQQKQPKRNQGQTPRRSRPKNGLGPSKGAQQEDKRGPSKFVENVKEGLVFRPTTEEWSDPMAFVESIADQLNEYGLCRVIPPDGWKPECKLHVNTKFTTEIQYIHRLMHRWKSRSKQLACIKRHLEEKDKVAYHPPLFHGFEIDLVAFSEVVAQQGGLKAINNSKRWNKVADLLNIPKTFQGRVNRLDSVYCKYLLSYDSLSKEEKQRLETETEMLRKQVASRLRSHDHEVNGTEEVVCKGRPTTLSNFCRMAGLAQQMHCRKGTPTPDSIEDDYWNMVDAGEPHVTVHTGQLDANLPTRHNWNCQNIGRNPSNLLHLFPSQLRVNMPEIRLSMLYGSEGWSTDSQGLSQIEFLHTGSPKIWYGIPASHCNKFQQLLQSEVPNLCTHQPHCLHRNNLHCMVPPSVLTSQGIPVHRLVQQPGEFVIVARGAARATLCTGYNMAEGIPFASTDYLQDYLQAFQIAKELKQSTLFSVEQLVCVLATNAAKNETNPTLLRELKHELTAIRDRELSLRQRLSAAGLKSSMYLPEPEAPEDSPSTQSGVRTRNQVQARRGCHVCRQQCYLSMVVSDREDKVYCLQHALHAIKTKTSEPKFSLKCRYSESQLRELVASLDCSNIHSQTSVEAIVAATPTSIAATSPLSGEEEIFPPTFENGPSTVAATSGTNSPPPSPEESILPPTTLLPQSVVDTVTTKEDIVSLLPEESLNPGNTTVSTSPVESRLRKKSER